MTFIYKYSNLGETELIRIPKKCIPHIHNILEKYNEMYGIKGEEFMNKIHKSIENKLNSYY